MSFERLVADEASFVMRTYGRQPVAFVRGEGAHLWDTEGREYLDFLSGIAVMSVGHSHPKVVEAIRAQAGALTHVSNLYYTEPQVMLAKRLHELIGFGKTFFANSGAEANECALKLARRYARENGRDAIGVVAALGSFHGRTFTTLAATGQPAKHEAFSPLPPWFSYVELNDVDALSEAIGPGTAAVLLEVVQGEGGVRPAEPEFLKHARALCDEHGAVLIYDEVQTGLGRTGAWFGFQHLGIEPDIVTLAKALGAGLPIGACVAREAVAEAFRPGDHATTFGGGPVPCAAALAVLDVIESEGLVENSAAMGARLVDGLRAATADNPFVVEARGMGLLVALELAEARSAEVVGSALEAGLIVNNVTPTAVRFAPPLVVGPAEVDRAVEVVAGIVNGWLHG